MHAFISVSIHTGGNGNDSTLVMQIPKTTIIGRVQTVEGGPCKDGGIDRTRLTSENSFFDPTLRLGMVGGTVHTEQFLQVIWNYLGI